MVPKLPLFIIFLAVKIYGALRNWKLTAAIIFFCRIRELHTDNDNKKTAHNIYVQYFC